MNGTFECFKCGDVATQVVTLCAKCTSKSLDVQPASAQQLKPKMPSYEEAVKAIGTFLYGSDLATFRSGAEAMYKYIAQHFGH